MKQKLLKKFSIKKFLLSIIFCSAILFYGYFSLPYLNKNLAWKDIKISGLRLESNGPEYDLDKGYLSKRGQSRKIKFELNPLKLIENEKVLRLALFYVNTNEDPLFTAPGEENELYKASVERLSLIHSELKNIYKIEADVIPIDFLRSVQDVYESEGAMKTQKDFESGRSLLSKYLISAKKYRADAQELFSEVEKREDSKIIVQHGSITSAKVILADLEKIEKNSHLLEKEINKRSYCLNVSTFFCSRSFLDAKDKTTDAGVNPGSQEDFTILNDNDLYLTNRAAKVEMAGPYEIETSCWTKGQDKGIYQMYAVKEPTNYGTKLIPKLATTNYYHEMSEERPEEIDKQYKKHGLEWRIVLETTPYACNDLEYQAKLATVDSYAGKYKTSHLISNFTGKGSLPDKYADLFKRAEELEEQFSKEKFPRYKTVEQLSGFYKNIYATIVIEENLGNNEDWLKEVAKIKEEILKRSLTSERKLAQLDKTLFYFSFMLDANAEINRYLGISDGKRDYLYKVRSGYSLTFLGFSKSVWRSQESLKYLENGPQQIDDTLVDFDSLVEKFGSDYVRKITELDRYQIWLEMLGKEIK